MNTTEGFSVFDAIGVLLSHPIILFFIIAGVLAFLMPFFVFRIRHETISINKKMAQLISLLEHTETENTVPDNELNAHANVEKPLAVSVGPDNDTTWKEAEAWVEDLNKDGETWRLPSIKEIEGLYKKYSERGGLVQALKTNGQFLWSSNTDGAMAQYFDLYKGSDNFRLKIRAKKFRAIAVHEK